MLCEFTGDPAKVHKLIKTVPPIQVEEPLEIGGIYKVPFYGEFRYYLIIRHNPWDGKCYYVFNFDSYTTIEENVLLYVAYAPIREYTTHIATVDVPDSILQSENPCQLHRSKDLRKLVEDCLKYIQLEELIDV